MSEPGKTYLKVAYALCCVGLGLVILSTLFMLAFTRAPSIGTTLVRLALPAALLLAVSVVVFRYRDRMGPLPLLPALAAGLIGFGIAAFGLLNAARDPGDWILYIGPVLLGAGFLALAFEPEEEQG